jgi:uncharacterized protein (TIGR00730 family)
MKICVYCASSSKVDEVYLEAADRLGRECVAARVSVVYGGGATGLMGRLADAVLSGGGTIKGIMPKFMNDVEWAHKKVMDFEFTETMHERKAKFLEGIDAVVALPGGTGTLEELLEAVTLKRLGLFTKPIIIVNTRGFYDPLRQMVERCIEQSFMHPRHRGLWSFVDEPEQVLPAVSTAVPWGSDAISFARNE